MRRRTLGWCAVALLGSAAVGSLLLAGLAAKERDDTFCVACHLHEEKFKRFTSIPFTDLSGPHHAKDVRCIDCHGGADPGMRARVWLLAAVDTGRYLIGKHREPDDMKLVLRSKECSYCHTPIVKRPRPQPLLSAEQEEAQEGRGGNAYHAIRPHDAVRMTCTRCHPAHTTDGDPKAQFIARKRVEPACRECHKTLGE